MVYIIEAILKLIALGPIQYFRDAWNTFDFTVTAIGVIEIGLEGVQGLSVLRAFRLVSDCVFDFFAPLFALRIHTFSLSVFCPT